MTVRTVLIVPISEQIFGSNWDGPKFFCQVSTDELKNSKSKALFRHPLFYYPIYTAKKEYNVIFWWPQCPLNFVALGMVAHKDTSGNNPPEPGEFYCVNAELCDIPMNGEFENQWSTQYIHKFGYSVDDEKLWDKFQKLPFFSVAASGLERLFIPEKQEAHQPWLLKKELVAFWVEKPIDRIETSDIRLG